MPKNLVTLPLYLGAGAQITLTVALQWAIFFVMLAQGGNMLFDFY